MRHFSPPKKPRSKQEIIWFKVWDRTYSHVSNYLTKVDFSLLTQISTLKVPVSKNLQLTSSIIVLVNLSECRTSNADQVLNIKLDTSIEEDQFMAIETKTMIFVVVGVLAGGLVLVYHMLLDFSELVQTK